MDHDRRDAIENCVLGLKNLEDVTKLTTALSGMVANPLK